MESSCSMLKLPESILSFPSSVFVRGSSWCVCSMETRRRNNGCRGCDVDRLAWQSRWVCPTQSQLARRLASRTQVNSMPEEWTRNFRRPKRRPWTFENWHANHALIAVKSWHLMSSQANFKSYEVHHHQQPRKWASDHPTA
jgi:hypothetical protein